MWLEVLNLFLTYYGPCDTIAESTHQFSTDQLKGMLERHGIGFFTTEELVTELTNRQYKYDYTSDLCMEWLFKEVKPVG